MTRLTNYLTEQRSKEVSVEFVTDWIKKNPAGIKSVIYRGVESESVMLFVQPSKHERQSAHTELNYYTLLFDNLPSWKSYPKRSKSLVCTTDDGAADNYGRVYRVFFKTGSKIGICPERDLWECFSDHFDTMDTFNHILENIFANVNGCDKDPQTYEQLVNNFAWIDRFKLGLFDDVNNFDQEEWEEENPDGDYKPLGHNEVIDKAVDLIQDLVMFGQIFGSGPKKELDTLTANFLRGKKDFMEYLEGILKPESNGFEITKVGGKLPNKVEVWSDGDAVLVADYEADEILRSI
jgi:hypothetical protein